MSDQVGISEAHDAGKVVNRVAMMVWRDLEALTTGEPIVAKALEKDRSQMNRDLKSLARKGLVEATKTKPATWRATNKETP